MKILLPKEIEMIRKIEKVTDSDYGIVEEAIDTDELLVLITELWTLYEGLNDDFKAYERYVEENYKQITKEEQING